MGYGYYMGKSQKTNEAAEIEPIYQAKGNTLPKQWVTALGPEVPSEPLSTTGTK